jgi:preprotein translocase subunit SecB
MPTSTEQSNPATTAKVFSPLQLKDYFLEYLQLEANPQFRFGTGGTYQGNVGVEFEFKKQENANIFRVDLDVSVNPTQEMFAQAPYRIKIKLQTILEFEGSYPEDRINELLGPNGLAMAYSIARGIVGQATGTSLHGKFILPTVNFIELLKQKSEEAKKLTASA